MANRRRFTAKFKAREGLEEVFERRAPGGERSKAEAETQTLHAKKSATGTTYCFS